MTVKQLIAKLQKMPQSAQVGFRDHDASEHEISSWVDKVSVLDKSKVPFPDYLTGKGEKWERDRYDSMPKITVVLG